MTLHRIDNQSRGEVEKMHDELVLMLCLDSERLRNISGEVAQVPSDNHVRAPPNRSGQHMPVIRIRQTETARSRFLECRESGHRSDTEFLVISGQFPKRGSPLFIHLALVFHHCFEPDAPVRAHAAILDPAFVKRTRSPHTAVTIF
jgi:hypothetical protein